MILLNPIVFSVIVLVVLCLFRLNVLMALLISAISGGLIAGMGIEDVMKALIGGMGGNSETALSYILLGTLAAGMAYTGIADILSQKISKMIKGKKFILYAILVVIACCSQNIIPVHIAFIPILIPPLLHVMNKLKIDRRAIACCLAFGLKAPYIALPFGFGLIFQTIIADNLTQNGMEVAAGDVWKTTIYIGASMMVGLIIAIFIFNKPREYKDIEIVSPQVEITENTKLNKAHIITLIGAFLTLIIQLKFKSLPLGALIGIIVMIAGGAIKWNDIDKVFSEGISIMGMIAFIMLVASGYGNVIRETGAVNELVQASLSIMGNSKFIASCIMMVIGLIVTMGIGTSFGTVPILAILYVPLCSQMGFSVSGTIILIAAAAALGDAGSPASDTTLGPTAGLNVDGQHNHIWDTCVPTAIAYNVPIAISAILLASFVI